VFRAFSRHDAAAFGSPFLLQQQRQHMNQYQNVDANQRNYGGL